MLTRMADTRQTYATHRRYFPLFHFFAIPLLIANVIVRFIYAVRHAGARLVWWEVIVAVVLVGLAFAARIMVLTVQNRLIVLEETLRLGRVLPADLQARVGELSRGQLIALRFCGDDKELAALTGSILNGELKGRDEIKKSIRTWRPDEARA
jgi:hypothetical protein